MTLLGRDRELDRLAAALVERKRVAVIGEAGAGKTALLREATLARQTLRGGAFATLSWLPFLSISRALGVPIENATAFEVAQVVIERTADGTTLVLDDLHWADSDTLHVLELLPPSVHVLAAVRQGDEGTRPALVALERAGFELLEVPPLDDESSRRVVEQSAGGRAIHVDSVVARAGGNPLLLEELARADREASTLEATVRARLAALPDDARQDFSLLALAGRPLALEAVPTSEALRAAGLVTVTDTVTPRHGLIAETAVDSLEDEDRLELHLRLAAIASNAGDRARHLAAAGRTEAAHVAALEAAATAATPGERAAHLALAASHATGADADALRLEAAQGLYDLRRLEDAERLLGEVEGTDPQTRAHAYLLEKLVALNAGETERAERAIEEGLKLVAGSGSPIEIRLLVARLDIPLFVHGDAAKAVVLGTTAMEAARARGVEEARAYAGLGTAMIYAGRPRDEWEPCFRHALERARAEGDAARELYAATNLLVSLEEVGALEEAAALTREMIPRARQLGFEENATVMLFGSLEQQASTGDLEGAVAEANAVLAGPVATENRLLFLFRGALALIDLGRFVEAEALVASMRGLPWIRSDFVRVPDLVECELYLWRGQSREALRAATQQIASLTDADPGSIAPHLAVVAAQAALELRVPLPVVELESEYWERRARAAAEERAALEALASDAPEAPAALAAATSTWADIDIRGELRCAWRTGESHVRRGELDEARRILEAAETTAAAVGMTPLLARIRRTLRATGASRSASRSTDGVLTAREAEVLGLVGDGLTNDEIAARLGVTLGTVKRLVSSASRKLGAHTRAQAAALASRAGR